MAEYHLSGCGSLDNVFCAMIVNDVLKHMRKMIEEGARLKVLSKQNAGQKLLSSVGRKLGVQNYSNDLYLCHETRTITNGIYTDYIKIHDLDPFPGVPNWQVYYRLLLLGKESKTKVHGSNLGGNRLGTANEVVVNVTRGNVIEVEFEMSGRAFGHLCVAQKFSRNLWPAIKHMMNKKWGGMGILFGTPGSTEDKTKDNENFQYVRRKNGAVVGHVGGPMGAWIPLEPEDDQFKYRFDK